MGQCGCGDGSGHYKLRTADGWFVLNLYPGCQGCDTPAGVQVLYYPDSSTMLTNIEDLPDLTDKVKQAEFDGILLPVFDFHKLVESDALEELPEPAEYETTKDLVGDMQYQIVQATIDTINQTLKEVT
jgi:hypothetical protein